jgi:hypothetical protein
MWLFFTIFGLVLFIPTGILFFILNRFKNTIVVLFKRNGALIKTVINDKILEVGQITEVNGKKIKPIKISKEEIYFGKWRRWIVKGELDSTLKKSNITDKEIEEYLNNEDLIKLYLAGKFKDTLMLMLGIIIFCVLVSGAVNGYLTNSKVCIIAQDNSTKQFIIDSVKQAMQTTLSIKV